MATKDNLKEAILVFMEHDDRVALEVNDISEGMGMTSFADFKKLVNALADLEREGQVFLNKKGKFKLQQKEAVKQGIFHSSTRGFGFIEVEGEDDDIFVPPNKTNFAMEGDLVTFDIQKEAAPWDKRGAEGVVRGIIEHGTRNLVGEFLAYDDDGVEETGFYGFVEPQDKKLADMRVFIRAEGIRPTDGSIVQVEITEYPNYEVPRGMQGLVTNVIGHKNDPGVDILTIVHKHGIPSEFPKEAIAQAEAVPDRVTEKDLEGRRDLRDEVVVTIDGADAKDLDDAVAVEKLSNGNYKLGVHIADVSYYVTEGSALDREAFERGTSVYLTDRVIPMIPQRLSNGICSLNPNVDRLTMSCEMEIDSSGNVVDYDIFSSVIRSKQRMTYDAVNSILMEHDEETREKYADLVPMFERMEELHHILEDKRVRRGSIDFDTKEAYIQMDPDGRPVDVLLRERGVGERLIESFMLAANETVSEHFATRQLPILYRIHEKPDPAKMQTFMEFVTTFGITMKGSKETVSPKQLQQVINKVKGRPEEAVVSMLMLRSMQQARYDVEPEGHYGLAAEYYSHFTSPIRRYPDLILHRLIHSYTEEGTSRENRRYWENQLQEIADQSSKTERRAVDAERETDELKKVQFMEDKIDQEFDAVVVSITGFGMFVQLPNTIEGLVHISSMNEDYFEYNERDLMLIGQRTGIVYRIGQNVKVKLVGADADLREIDFEVVPQEDTPRIDPPKRKRDRKGGSAKRRRRDSGGKDTQGGKRKGGGNRSGQPNKNKRSGKKNPRKKRR